MISIRVISVLTEHPIFNDSFGKRPVQLPILHPNIKQTLVAISERTGMTVSQVTDEVLYTGLIEIKELPDLSQ